MKEVFAFNTPEEDLVALEARYKSNDLYLRKELETLLSHWNGEIDKSRSSLLPLHDSPQPARTLSHNPADYQ